MTETKIFIIQQIDRKVDFEEIASAKSMSFEDVLTEIENICYSGTRLNIDYYLNHAMDDDKSDDIFEYFMKHWPNIKNIIVSAAERMHSAIIRAEKNEVNKKVLALVEAYPSEAFEVKGIPHSPVYNENGDSSTESLFISGTGRLNFNFGLVKNFESLSLETRLSNFLCIQ